MRNARDCITSGLAAFGLVLSLLVVGGAPAEAADKPLPAATARLLPDMTKGNPKARITVIEYGSATCSHCADWYAENWEAFDAEYIKTGKVKYVFREVATPPVTLAYSVYMLARCASEKQNPAKPDAVAYFGVLEGFWRRQEGVFKSRDYATPLKILGGKSGLSDADISACTADKARFADLNYTMQTRAEADKIDGTPTFFVNGTRVDGMELSDIKAAIAAAKPAR
jgi:protein-disulfide isomerase